MYTEPPASGVSFIIRMWKDPNRDHWHGRVEHIPSGEKISFIHPAKIPEICLTFIDKQGNK